MLENNSNTSFRNLSNANNSKSARWFVLLVAFAFTTLTSHVGVMAKEESPFNDDPLRFKEHIDTFVKWDRKNSVSKDEVLFIGSSSIVGWATQEAFPELKVINRGFGGSQLSDVLYYADKVVFPYKPRVIVSYEGDNDIASGKSPERILDDYRTFVGMVHKNLPDTSIIFIAIKPSGSRWEMWPKMKQANTMIKEYSAGDDQLLYVDTSVGLLGKNGEPDDSLFLEDRLHMNNKGYKIWNQMVRPLIVTAFKKAAN